MLGALFKENPLSFGERVFLCFIDDKSLKITLFTNYRKLPPFSHQNGTLWTLYFFTFLDEDFENLSKKVVFFSAKKM